MGRKKRERKKIPREERKNLRLWAEGSREEILRAHFDAYAKAFDTGWREERAYLKKVCREYHARIHWTVTDHEEPILVDFDAAAIIPKEILEPDKQVEKRARRKVLNGVCHRCHSNNPSHAILQRIRRWYKYRICRQRKHLRSMTLDPRKDPYAVLLAKFSGLYEPPKARQAFQQYMVESYEKIAPVVTERWAAGRESLGLGASRKEPKAGYRAAIARELFAALPEVEQKEIATRAKTTAATAKAAYMKGIRDPPSTSPVARQA